MIKAIFIALSHAQADYWARQWGYFPYEWKYINTRHPEEAQGYYKPEMPAYICGTEGPSNPLWIEMEARGFRVYDAETLNVA